jgi:hypothetical protein
VWKGDKDRERGGEDVGDREESCCDGSASGPLGANLRCSTGRIYVQKVRFCQRVYGVFGKGKDEVET